jgi:hypothetical protein|tara:strand:- start:406 stop:1002 length:597 start_codon:yes stop_codon:yes gene_type:complete
MEVKFESIFSSFLITVNLDINHEYIYSWCKKQSKTNVTRLTFEEEFLKEYYLHLSKLFGEIHKRIGLSPNYYQHLKRGWLNMDPNDEGFATPHRHCESTFTSVYYPYIEGKVGDLELLAPNPLVQWVFKPEQDPERNQVAEPNIFNMTRIRIPPKTGLLVVFPSWIQHLALPTKNGIRTSISVDSLSTLRITGNDLHS